MRPLVPVSRPDFVEQLRRDFRRRQRRPDLPTRGELVESLHGEVVNDGAGLHRSWCDRHELPRTEQQVAVAQRLRLSEDVLGGVPEMTQGVRVALDDEHGCRLLAEQRGHAIERCRLGALDIDLDCVHRHDPKS